MTRHPCSYPDCAQMIDTRFFMCPRHWALLPREVQAEVTVAYTKRMNAYGTLSRALGTEGITVGQRRAARQAYFAAQADHERVKAAVVEMLEDERGA